MRKNRKIIKWSRTCGNKKGGREKKRLEKVASLDELKLQNLIRGTHPEKKPA